MNQVYALQRQQRKRKPLTRAEFAFAEPTSLFAPVASTSTSTLPSEEQEHPSQVAQFRHALDQISIQPPVSSMDTWYAAEQSAMQQTGTQFSPVQRKKAGRQLMSQEDAPLQLVAKTLPAPGDTVYVMKPGDTLAQIADNYKMPLQALAEYNQIADPTQVPVGTQINIPTGETTTPQSAYTPQSPNTQQPKDTSQQDTPQSPNTQKPTDTSEQTDTPQSAYTPPPTPAPPPAPTPPPAPAPADNIPQHNTANLFPYGQCTWWANERYHQLTGYFVPWTTNSNADQWTDRAHDFGWHVSDQPTVGAIIDFQAGVQLASDVGHVAIVEQILSNGNLITSNMNIIGHPFGQVADLTNQAGPGVTFITYK